MLETQPKLVAHDAAQTVAAGGIVALGAKLPEDQRTSPVTARAYPHPALDGEITPERLLSLPSATLRSVGLSGAKAASLQDLSTKVLDGTVVLDPKGLRAESDAEVVARLSTVRGIGRWTSEMFLMFQLRRLDVWPTGDLGVRRGFGLAWGIPTPTAKELEPLGDPYRPYRSVVAWYCWRAAELYGGAASSAVTR